jgi:hypothetical protein
MSQYRGHLHERIIHHIICQHQIEIGISPGATEVYFGDERYSDPANTQARFTATVYNAPTGHVSWSVRNLAGGPGVGFIDQSGLYLAPPKGTLSHGTTDVILATSSDDPLRKAFAFVTLIGVGPEPLPTPSVDIFPKYAYLYYPSDHQNKYIDTSNTMQMFRATLRKLRSASFVWKEDGTMRQAGPEELFLYEVHGSGTQKTVKISVEVAGQSGVIATATVVILNYNWPPVG